MNLSTDTLDTLAAADDDAQAALDALTSALTNAGAPPDQADLDAVQSAVSDHAGAQADFRDALEAEGLPNNAGLPILEVIEALRDAGHGNAKAALTKLPAPAEPGLVESALRWSPDLLDTAEKRHVYEGALTVYA